MINTRKHLAYKLRIDKSEFDSIIERIDTYYRRKEEIKFDKNGQPKTDSKGNVKKRIFYPSMDRLKVIQRKIHKNVLSEIKIPDYAYGAIKKKDNVMNAKVHQGKKFIFTTDLRSFFPSINHKMVYKMFLSFNYSPEVARLLTQLTTYKGMIPQGAPTSSAVANLVFIRTGSQLEKFAKENGITFTSFIDDLTFSAPNDFKEKVQQFINIIIADGYRISHNKTNYKTKNPVVTGVTVKNNNLSLPDSFKIELENLEDKTPEQINGLLQYEKKVLQSNNKKGSTSKSSHIP